MDQVISVGISPHSVHFPRSKTLGFSLSRVPIAVRPNKRTLYRDRLRLCTVSRNFRPVTISPFRLQQYLVQALPLQALTTDNDSEGSTFQGSSTPVEYNDGSFQPDQTSRHSFLYYIQLSYANARKQGLLGSTKRVLELSKTDSRELQQLESNQPIVDLWEATSPWIKWPVSIFLPWFLVVSVFYGISASMDLLPLWTIGAVVASVTIKAGVQLSTFCGQWIAEWKLTQRMKYVIESVKTAKLQDLVEQACLKYEEGKQYIVQKRLDLVSYIKSGRIVVVLREYYNKKSVELWEVYIDKYEDWRLVYFNINRKLRSIV